MRIALFLAVLIIAGCATPQPKPQMSEGSLSGASHRGIVTITKDGARQNVVVKLLN